MFTGITRGTFPITCVEQGAGVLHYEVELPDWLVVGLEVGASVAIDGVCQTVVSVEGTRVRFDAIDETLARTTLDTLQVGRRVGVERSYRVGDEVGGHEVAGHVLGTGVVSAREAVGDNLTLRVQVPAEWMKYLTIKGFVAIDGCSLTVGHVDPSGSFALHLIPETLRLTNLGTKAVGERVNVELDHRTVTIVDTVERVLAQRLPS